MVVVHHIRRQNDSDVFNKVSGTIEQTGAGKSNETKLETGKEDTLLFKLFVMSPERVADIVYNALMKRKTAVVAGIYNKILVMSSYILPDRLVDYFSKMMLEKQYQTD